VPCLPLLPLELACRVRRWRVSCSGHSCCGARVDDRRCAARAGGEKRLALSRRIYDGASGASVRVREELTIRVQPGWQEGQRCALTDQRPCRESCACCRLRAEARQARLCRVCTVSLMSAR
jgi:hypothetical protein